MMLFTKYVPYEVRVYFFEKSAMVEKGDKYLWYSPLYSNKLTSELSLVEELGLYVRMK